MRVAVVSPETGYHRSDDSTRRLDRVLEGLADRGHDVTVLCTRWWEGSGSDRIDGGRTVEIDGVAYRGLAAEETGGFRLRVPTALRGVHPDVIHAVASPETVLAARVGASLARAPLVAEWYDPAVRGWTARQAARRPDRTVVPSRHVRRRLRELGADRTRLQVVPDAVSFDRIRDVEPDDEGEIVYARRLDEDANLESLLLGLAELRDRGWSATVIGDGPERRVYERQARDLRIDDRVRFVGARDRSGRIGIYRGAHVFVQTARHCPFATELLWALACGCIGIVEYHADSSAHELVEGRERGFRTTTPDEMAEAIRRAGALERLTVDESFEQYDESAVLDRYLECYRAVQRDQGTL